MTKIKDYTFRQAYYNDLEALSELGRKTFEDTYKHHFKKNFTLEALENYLDYAFSIEKIKKEYANPKARFYILKKDQTTLGYCKLTGIPLTEEQEMNEPTLTLERIYLDKSLQGQGIGKEILKQIIEIAEKNKKLKIRLQCWENHTTSLDFYQKNGFKIIDKTTFKIEATEFNDTDFILERPVV